MNDWQLIEEVSKRIMGYGALNWRYFSLETAKEVKQDYKKKKIVLFNNGYVVAGKISKKDKVIAEFTWHDKGMPLPEMKPGQNVSDIKLPDVKFIHEVFSESLGIVEKALEDIKIENDRKELEALEKDVEPLNERIKELKELLK